MEFTFEIEAYRPETFTMRVLYIPKDPNLSQRRKNVIVLPERVDTYRDEIIRHAPTREWNSELAAETSNVDLGALIGQRSDVSQIEIDATCQPASTDEQDSVTEV